MRYSVFFIAFVGLMMSNACKESSKPATKAASQVKTFEAIPKEKIDFLYHNCDYTDYIFHELPFSMSQNEKPAILQNFSFIGAEAMPTIPPDCKPVARQMFHVKGEIVAEMDVYYTEFCKFYTWIEKEKPIYAVKMTEGGDLFYKQMIGRAVQAGQQMQQQQMQNQ